MYIELSKDDFSRIATDVTHKITSAANYSEITKLSEEKAREFFMRWANDIAPREIKHMVKGLLKENLASIAKEAAREILAEGGTDTLKIMMADHLRDLLGHYDGDE